MEKQAKVRIKDHKGRHRMLKAGSSYYSIWHYVKSHEGATMPEIRKACVINHQRVYDLLREGLLEARGQQGKRQYYIVAKNATGNARDKLKITLQVFKNDYGWYSINAKLHGEVQGATDGDTNPKLLTTRGIVLVVPKITDTVHSENDLQTSAPVPTYDLEIRQSLTLDVDFITIE